MQAHRSSAPSGIPGSGSHQDGNPVPQHDELADLATAAEHGDPIALRTLLTTIMPLLLRVVRRVLGPRHPELEDVAYEAAHAVIDGLPRFRREGTFRHYACRIAAFTATTVRRREASQKRNRLREQVDVDLFAARERCPEQQAAAASLTPVVRQLVGTLSRPLAEALVLHVVLGFTVEEISRSSGAPAETIRSRLRLARQALRKQVVGNPILLEALELDP